jgi:hypothetical protein
MMNYSINTEYFRSHLLAVIGSAAGRELSEKNKSEYPFGLFQWPHLKWGLLTLCAATFPSATSVTSATLATFHPSHGVATPS